jgi:hypothetical protein
MHAVVRTYSGKGANELFDVLEKNKAEVEELMRPVSGLVTYSLVRTTSGDSRSLSARTKLAPTRAYEWRETGLPRMLEIPVLRHRQSRKAQ